MVDLLWFALLVAVVMIGGLLIGLLMVWIIGWLTRRSGRDEEDGVTPVGPPPEPPAPARATAAASAPAEPTTTAAPAAQPLAQPGADEAASSLSDEDRSDPADAGRTR